MFNQPKASLSAIKAALPVPMAVITTHGALWQAASLFFWIFPLNGEAMSDKKMDDLRRTTNPLFNDRKLKLGTFCTNLDYGAAMSTIDGTLRINWPNTVSLARIANGMDFEALVPVGRWRGFGGKTNRCSAYRCASTTNAMTWRLNGWR